ncbi:hypothetical protein D3C80_1626720 [compost metagenome]
MVRRGLAIRAGQPQGSGRFSRRAGLPVSPSAVQLLRKSGAGQPTGPRSPFARRRHWRLAGHQRLFGGGRGRHAAAGGFLQAAGQPQYACRLFRCGSRRSSYRPHHQQPAQWPAVEQQRGGDHLRRKRRLVGSRCAATGRSLGAGIAHSGVGRLAVRP